MGSPAPASVDQLLEAARAVRENAHAPYSMFAVGAAVLAGGRVFTGVNVENAAYPMGICAERAAVASAVTAGEQRIDAVAVVGSAEEPSPPCGGCRQVLFEFGPGMLVAAEGLGGARAEWSLNDLLPDAFGPHSLR